MSAWIAFKSSSASACDFVMPVANAFLIAVTARVRLPSKAYAQARL
jgi:hypothetical protein